jgi:NAD-dependent SIR2 family protein deacetylase
MEEAVRRAASAIASADGLLITAGAGMGVDSGLPDFRGSEGFWEAYPALARSKMSFMQIANPAAFEADPERAWGFYGHRLKCYRETVPHDGFAMLKVIGQRMSQGMFVFTSNVDGQFQKAGFDANLIVEVHGSIHHLQCQHACMGDIWRADDFTPVVDHDECRLLSDPPRCPYCGAIARPNILMFGDWNWLGFRADAQKSAMNAWLEKVERLVVIEIGAGTDIPTVRNLGERTDAILIRINPREPGCPSDRCIPICSGGLEGIRAIFRCVSAE